MRWFLIIGSMALAFPQLAGATTLYTPPFSTNNGGVCSLVNVGKKPLSVTIDVVNGVGGGVVNTATTTAAPGQSVQDAPTVNFDSTEGYCRFTFDGGKHSVRAAYYENGSGPSFPLQVVVPAQ